MSYENRIKLIRKLEATEAKLKKIRAHLASTNNQRADAKRILAILDEEGK